MEDNSEREISERLQTLEEKVDSKQSRSFITTLILAFLPVCFGLYQFHLSNEYKKEDSQTRALLAALEGETPSEICGNLSLLVEGGLVTEGRLSATKTLISKITERDSQILDGGIDKFDCLPRIVPQGTELASNQYIPPEVSLNVSAPPADGNCNFDEFEIRHTADHDSTVIQDIEEYLKSENLPFSTFSENLDAKEADAYSGQIWFYYPAARPCAQYVLDGLKAKGLDLKLRYYTRAKLPLNLPIRIWPGGKT